MSRELLKRQLHALEGLTGTRTGKKTTGKRSRRSKGGMQQRAPHEIADRGIDITMITRKKKMVKASRRNRGKAYSKMTRLERFKYDKLSQDHTNHNISLLVDPKRADLCGATHGHVKKVIEDKMRRRRDHEKQRPCAGNDHDDDEDDDDLWSSDDDEPTDHMGMGQKAYQGNTFADALKSLAHEGEVDASAEMDAVEDELFFGKKKR
eukprot:TRINITY_DN4543_c0_g2_i1.p1 TRINITY_DN4543_c0_g2~~TRINITY_DN4543_c0_g2_i1.p1  ORF type:complete len:207 (+),score=53.81 TRINITY_DN4543_c0_g2_i1:238-858(+)